MFQENETILLKSSPKGLQGVSSKGISEACLTRGVFQECLTSVSWHGTSDQGLPEESILNSSALRDSRKLSDPVFINQSSWGLHHGCHGFWRSPKLITTTDFIRDHPMYKSTTSQHQLQHPFQSQAKTGQLESIGLASKVATKKDTCLTWSANCYLLANLQHVTQYVCAQITLNHLTSSPSIIILPQ